MDPYLESNRRLWDSWTPFHVGGAFYDVAGFKKGRDPLDPLVTSVLPDLQGKRLLHLQCHFGMDTLALARRGAEVTGVDFSPKAIAAARRLAEECGIEARFIECAVAELPDVLDDAFDVVFTSAGVLCWLGDLGRWADVIAHFLKPGGLFVIVEGHPFTWMFDSERDDDRLVPQWSYFDSEPRGWPVKGSYAMTEADDTEAGTSYERMHTLSDIVGAVLGAGLEIQHFREHPEIGYQALPFLVKGEDGLWRLPEGYPGIPLAFSLRATKPRVGASTAEGRGDPREPSGG